MNLFIRRDGMIYSRLEDFDLALLRLVPPLLDTVGEPGIDPAADRLQPEIYADDAARSAEFRRLAGELVDQARDDDAATLRDLIGTVSSGGALTDDQAGGWMRAINQARLVLGARLGIEEDGWEHKSGLSPEDPHVVMLHLLGRIQEDLIAALAAPLD